MSQDILFKKNDDGLYDLSVAGSDFEATDGMETALLVSMFTDARAPSSAIPSAKYRRGWIGDILTSSAERQLGSLLWLYEQSRLTRELINKIRIEAENAFAWMVEDNIAKNISVEVTNETKRGIVLQVTIVTKEGVSQKYQILWRATSANNL